MSTQTFSSVATRVVGQYGEVGKLVVGAYRAGTQRFFSGASARYASFVNSRSLPLVNDDVKASLIDAQQQVASFVEGGITGGSDRAEQAIEMIAAGVRGGIRRVASAAERVESAFDTSAISTVGLLTMPVAQLSLAIANRAVENTKRLSGRVVGTTNDVVEDARPARRAARKATRRARR